MCEMFGVESIAYDAEVIFETKQLIRLSKAFQLDELSYRIFAFLFYSQIGMLLQRPNVIHLGYQV